MKEVILLRFGEIFLKGKNYSFFENTLFRNVKHLLSKFNVTLYRTQGRFLVSDFKDKDKDRIIDTIKCIFGLTSMSIASEVESKFDSIYDMVNTIKLKGKTFKVDTNRADKRFPMHSYDLCCTLGDLILKNNPGYKVDVHNPEETVHIDIRHNGKAYIFYDKIPCLGGMPVGTAGKGMLLLSGGIDSPVAGYLMAKRGLLIDAIHFHSYPYTSAQARQKVIDLANIMKNYTGNINLFMVSLTKIQEEIHKKCDPRYMVTLVRRFMMDIAERVAKSAHDTCIVTGENLGQVASQTVEGITSTAKMAKDLIIFRPLLSFDKIEITKIAENIGTYDTSVLPYEDCCTLFLPKNPITHPHMDKVLENEKLLDREKLIEKALSSIETIRIEV